MQLQNLIIDIKCFRHLVVDLIMYDDGINYFIKTVL